MQSSADRTSQAKFAHLAGQAARAVPGVAAVAASDIQVHMAQDGSVDVNCTLTAYQDVQLHEVGVAVQMAIAAVLKRAVRVDVRSVNISIIDIDERAPLPRTSNPLGKKRHYG